MSTVDPLMADVAGTPSDDGRPEAEPPAAQRRWWREAIRGNVSALVGLVMFAAITLAAIFAPLLAPTALGEQVGGRFGAPSGAWPLGLDDAGQNMITLLLYSTRTTLVVGLGATAVAMIIGTIVGIVAGYVGRRTDGALMRFTDFFLVIPEVPLMMIIAAVWGPGIVKLILVIGLILWTWTARVIRAQTKSVRERVYVKRAKSLGASDWHTVTRHVFPQVAPLLVVNTVLTFAVAVFDETALSFLGLGDPNRPSLGRMIELASKANAVTNQAWWAIFYPGVVVTLIILSLTLMGTALENALNPRLRVSHLSRKHFRLARNISTDREAVR